MEKRSFLLARTKTLQKADTQMLHRGDFHGGRGKKIENRNASAMKSGSFGKAPRRRDSLAALRSASTPGKRRWAAFSSGGRFIGPSNHAEPSKR
ncbi:MAG: hypothetical protein AB1921_02005 [Thermodesulfobacteriota bacterium]